MFWNHYHRHIAVTLCTFLFIGISAPSGAQGYGAAGSAVKATVQTAREAKEALQKAAEAAKEAAATANLKDPGSAWVGTILKHLKSNYDLNHWEDYIEMLGQGIDQEEQLRNAIENGNYFQAMYNGTSFLNFLSGDGALYLDELVDVVSDSYTTYDVCNMVYSDIGRTLSSHGYDGTTVASVLIGDSTFALNSIAGTMNAAKNLISSKTIKLTDDKRLEIVQNATKEIKDQNRRMREKAADAYTVFHQSILPEIERQEREENNQISAEVENELNAELASIELALAELERDNAAEQAKKGNGLMNAFIGKTEGEHIMNFIWLLVIVIGICFIPIYYIKSQKGEISSEDMITKIVIGYSFTFVALTFIKFWLF